MWAVAIGEPSPQQLAPAQAGCSWEIAVANRRRSCSVFGVVVVKNSIVESRRKLRLRKQIRNPLFGAVRCTVEPRQYVEGPRKCAPLLGNSTTPNFGRQSEWKAVPDIWKTTAELYGERVALHDPHRQPPVKITYKELEQAILDFAEGLRVYGICPDQTVALISDNSYKWLIADQGIMAAGAANAVRGSRSSTDELVHIICHSDSVALVVDNPELYNRLAPRLMHHSRLKFVVVLWGSKSDAEACLGGTGADPGKYVPLYAFDELMASGHTSRQALAAANSSATHLRYEVIRPDDVATIVYTSGTSGSPKGVMLTHANLLHQVKDLPSVVKPEVGERFLTLLPPWHMYERSAEYFALSQGVVQVYSSVKNFKDDMTKYPPDLFVAVPLVLDVLYNGVQKKLSSGSRASKFLAFALINISLKYKDLQRVYQGMDISSARKSQSSLAAAALVAGSYVLAHILLPLHLLAKILVYKKIFAAIGVKRALISGGGSLAPHIDKFFEAVGITVLNGYGLTETSPVLSARLSRKNIIGTVGWPIPKTEIKIVDAESGKTVLPGVRGLVKARGPQVMKGYYKDPVATSQAIDEDGWFDTGDLGWLAPDNQVGGAYACRGVLVLDGRAKDTIVLATGENVDPTQIEEVVQRIKLVKQVVVVGQDKRRLGALIVVDKDELQVGEESSTPEALRSVIRNELKKCGEQLSFPIGPFLLLDEAFSVENGLLTATFKIRRDAVTHRYQDQIEKLFNN